MTEISNYSKNIEKQFKYTISYTKKILKALKERFREKIMIQKRTEQYNPINDRTNFMIDGIYTKNSYIRNEFLMLNVKTKYILKITDDVTINIHIYHKKNTPEALLIKCVRRIYCMIKVFGNDKLEKYDGTDITILMYDAPRVMTDTYTNNTTEINDIGSGYYFNCTCGYAMIDENKFKICVTRRNGCLGLLVHELGHICGLDLGHFDGENYVFPNDRLTKWKTIVKKYFDIGEQCHIGNMTEGINNGNSSIIHSMFLALEGNKYHDLEVNYKKYYKMELLYSIKMLCKLMKWYRYETIRELVHKNKGKFNQKSQLLEYIFVRCIYLMNFKELGVIDKKDINDEEYLLKFFECLKHNSKILNVLINHTVNYGIISMEYYYNK